MHYYAHIMKSLLSLAICFFTLQVTVHAGDPVHLNADPGDSGIKSDGTLLDTDSYQARIGEYFYPSAGAYIMPVFLPSLPKGEVFTSANLRMQLIRIANENNGTLANCDLYGLGVRATAKIESTDYYEGAKPDPKATLIQAGFLTPTSPLRTDGDSGPFVTTSPEGEKALLAYLNKIYEGGKNGGKYVIFRVSYAVSPVPEGNNAYYLLTEKATGDNEKPQLTYTSGPPPGPFTNFKTAKP